MSTPTLPDLLTSTRLRDAADRLGDPDATRRALRATLDALTLDELFAVAAELGVRILRRRKTDAVLRLTRWATEYSRARAYRQRHPHRKELRRARH